MVWLAVALVALAICALMATATAVLERRDHRRTTAALGEERRSYAAYRKLFGPPKGWGETRSVTVVYELGKPVRPVQGKDLPPGRK